MTIDPCNLLVAALERQWDALYPDKAFPAELGDKVYAMLTHALFYEGEVEDEVEVYRHR